MLENWAEEFKRQVKKKKTIIIGKELLTRLDLVISVYNVLVLK